jgi:hypothetical protein
MEVSMQRDPSPGRQEVCNSPWEGTGFCLNRQSRPEYPSVSDRSLVRCRCAGYYSMILKLIMNNNLHIIHRGYSYCSWTSRESQNSLQSVEWISIRTRHLLEIVWDTCIGWAMVPGVPKLCTTAPKVLLYQFSEIAVTSMDSRNALLGSGPLLKLTLPSLHSASPHILLESLSD